MHLKLDQTKTGQHQASNRFSRNVQFLQSTMRPLVVLAVVAVVAAAGVAVYLALGSRQNGGVATVTETAESVVTVQSPQATTTISACALEALVTVTTTQTETSYIETTSAQTTVTTYAVSTYTVTNYGTNTVINTDCTATPTLTITTWVTTTG
jgi:hypothetical protein